MPTKLGKEEIQKIVLGVILAIVVIVGYFMVLLGPLQIRQLRTRETINGLKPKIDEARAQIKKTAEMEQSAPKATLVMKNLTALIPDGAPVAWFPTQVEDFFKREGVDKTVTHMMSETTEKELTGFRKISWGIDVPKADFVQFGQALANFENDELLVEIAGLQMEATHEDPEAQHVTLTVYNIAKQ